MTSPEERARVALHRMGMRDVDNDADVAVIALYLREAASEARAQALRDAIRAAEEAWDEELDRPGLKLCASAILRALRDLAGRPEADARSALKPSTENTDPK